MLSFYKNELRKYFLISTIIFVLSILVGVFVTVYAHDSVEFKNFLMQIFKKFEGIKSSGLRLDVTIFLNNLKASAIMLFLGIIPILCLPVIILFTNGFVIGVVVSYISMTKVSSVSLIILGLLPHGIFEIPAVLLSCALGIYVSTNIIKIFKKKIDVTLREMASNVIRFFVQVVIPLLLVAAIIEAYITPIVINSYK